MPVQDLTHRLIRSEDGTEIYADAVGNPSLPSIVFIHGLALSSIVFEGLFQDRTLLDNAYLVRHLLFSVHDIETRLGALRFARSRSQWKTTRTRGPRVHSLRPGFCSCCTGFQSEEALSLWLVSEDSFLRLPLMADLVFIHRICRSLGGMYYICIVTNRISD